MKYTGHLSRFLLAAFSLSLLPALSAEVVSIKWMNSSATAAPKDVGSTDYHSDIPYKIPESAQSNVDPRSMIVMSRDHQLFFKAYTDWSDIDGDGSIDKTYKSAISYYGYFDSQSCYEYSNKLESGSFKIAEAAKEDHSCSGNKYWSGNFLNWVSMTRMDILRKVLYGGKRIRDNVTDTTILERAYLPYDAHSFVKVVSDRNILNKNTPMNGEGPVSFCNTTGYTGNKQSKHVDKPPLLRVAQGEWKNWAANERWQCQWKGDKNKGEESKRPPSPGSDDGTNNDEYKVRVEVCTGANLDGDECTSYAGSTYPKPTGLLHEFADGVDFGLFSGSYEKNLSGGVLRANTRKFSEEFDSNTGMFRANVPGIVSNINAFRVSRYDYSDGTYNKLGKNGGDECKWEKKLSELDNGECSSWGNPLAEMTQEALRYLTGKASPTDAFHVGTSVKNEDSESPSFSLVETGYVNGLTSPAWDNDIGADWCAAQSMVIINSSEASFDADELGSDDLIDKESIAKWTNSVARDENISGRYFVGENDSDDNKLCTAKNIGSGNFDEVLGLCPSAPGLEGSYNIAGLTRYAFETPIVKNPNDDSQGNSVSTYAVRLSANTPVIDLGAVKIVPACENKDSSGRCAIVDFRPITIGSKSGSFDITWEDSEFGGDYDSDLEMRFSYELDTSRNELTITTDVVHESASAKMGVGYVLSGTDARFEDPEDPESSKITTDHSSGFIAHSGIEGYDGSLCDECEVSDGPNTQRYRIASGGSASELKPPLYYATKYGNTADEDSPAYFEVNQVDQLVGALRSVFTQVQNSGKRTGAGLGYSVSNNGRVFQTLYDNTDGWAGNLLAFETNANGIGDQLWNAQAKLPGPDARTFITFDSKQGKGVSLNPSVLPGDVIGYLRNAPLGDMIGSRPFVVDEPNSYYIPAGPSDTSYSDFKASMKDRPAMVYVGANDGMLHGFDVKTGEEKLAYMPGMLKDYVVELMDPDYIHRYYVDGSPTALDMRITNDWRTVLASGLGSGGRGLFALDVTEPGLFSEAKARDIALFEYTPATEQGLYSDDSLGHIYGNPSLVLLESGDYAVVFGNGYYSPSGKAALYIVKLEGAADGAIDASDVLRMLAPETSGLNGLSTASLVDLDGNGRVDTAYAGDLQGNLWRFDLTGNLANSNQPTLLFSAVDNGANQVITTAVEGGRHPEGGPMLFFGTGSRPELPIIGAEPRSTMGSFYAVRDRDSTGGGALTRDDLTERKLTSTITTDTQGNPVELRFFESSVNSLDSEHGWYMDFPGDERVVNDSLLYGDRILITTLIPGDGTCGAENGGFLYQLSVFQGRAVNKPALDINNDGVVDGQDQINDDIPVGMKTDGALFTPVVDTNLEDNTENLLTINDKGEPQVFEGEPLNPLSLGRVAWRELEN
ncbi:pilus assembly protein [Halomonas sp. GXIMD04776]|uniref:pilus assembly protein n=1 Tax=Halomonas sp. GXIMD04776 TaxID=3415605 RepID=UPI003C95F1D7